MVRVFPIFFKKKCGILFVAISVYSGCYFFGNFPLQIQSTNARHAVFLPQNALC